MKITEEGQEILEQLWICTIEEKKKGMKASKFADIETLKDLKAGDYIKISDGIVNLTKLGQQEARRVIRRHRLAERLLSDVLDIKGAGMETTACKFEHILSVDVAENICTLLGHPKVCPHGKSIPRGNCCKQGVEVAKKIVSSLSRLHKGDIGKIAYKWVILKLLWILILQMIFMLNTLRSIVMSF
jgi:DtxR family Mn-dependent transcriptional regulator